MGLTLCVRDDGSGAEVRIEGEIDVCVADRLQKLLLGITQAHGSWLLLDLSAVSFMDCAGLRALVLPVRHAEQRGWSVHLTAASPIVVKIITLTGAEDDLPVRNQSGNTGSGTSSQPEEEQYRRADLPWAHCTLLQDAEMHSSEVRRAAT
jgi:anti-sigma B factor antagonist